MRRLAILLGGALALSACFIELRTGVYPGMEVSREEPLASPVATSGAGWTFSFLFGGWLDLPAGVSTGLAILNSTPIAHKGISDTTLQGTGVRLDLDVIEFFSSSEQVMTPRITLGVDVYEEATYGERRSFGMEGRNRHIGVGLSGANTFAVTLGVSRLTFSDSDGPDNMRISAAGWGGELRLFARLRAPNWLLRAFGGSGGTLKAGSSWDGRAGCSYTTRCADTVSGTGCRTVHVCP